MAKCVYDISHIGIDPYEKTYPLVFRHDTLSVKLRIWGISHNHHKVVLSSCEKSYAEIDEKEDYIFRGELPIVFRVVGDSLYIVSSYLPSIPNHFKNKDKIVYKELYGQRLREFIQEHDDCLVIDYPSSE